MSLGDVALQHASVLVDELVARGMRYACLSPGSRSTPLALALERDQRVQTFIHLDERSSAFFALGIAKVTRQPVGVACTSGTAAAEFFPAVVEASQSRIQLVLMTADRPPRVRGTGANQTIDQTGLYGSYAAFAELPLPLPNGPVAGGLIRSLVGVAFDHAPTDRPVHLNVPFDEPLMPEGEVIGVDEGQVQTAQERALDDGPGEEARSAAAETVAGAIEGTNGVIVIGSALGGPLRQVLSLADALGWPVIAEPLSDCRVPPSAGGTTVLAAGQTLIGARAWVGSHTPQTVMQIGATPTTRATQALVAAAEHRIVVDRRHPDPDPEGNATIRLREDPVALATALLERGTPLQPADPAWLAYWRTADLAARVAMDGVLDAASPPFEPRIARDLVAALPAGATLFVGSSTPVRDLDLAMAPRADVRVLANRGASGIDGNVSTVLGAAAVAPDTGSPVYALMGDLTFLHDVGPFLWLARIGIDAVIIVVDNGGGGIFGLLAQRDLPEFDRLFKTPHDLSLRNICEAADVAYQRVEWAEEFVPSIHEAERMGGVVVVHVPIDGDHAIRRRKMLTAAVVEALRTAGPPARER
ncbi:MAG: 2-succinyl-5-enolpyruvyl-6-hydroxy-3-cyclohexene-1-carboxylic-acid synthase [Actinomycetota bacterium]